MANLLTDRWYPLRYHIGQSECYRSEARFNINHSGRRSGKTELLGKRKVVRLALKGDPKYPDWRCFVGAPVRHQAKKIYWSDFKKLIPSRFLLGKPNESELILRLINGSEIHIVGMDRPERVEGHPWNHGLLDEIANMKDRTWPEHVRPALADRKGSCDFIGVPEGRGAFYDLTENAKQHIRDMEKKGRKPLWKVWHWHSDEILDPEEIEFAKMDMDELVYLQEFGGEFVSFTGKVYYAFNENIHVGNYSKFYNPNKPLVLCFDFNVAPGIAVICQEIGSDVFDVPLGQTVTVALGEVYIPRNSNTVIVCNKIVQDWNEHKGLVLCYGDSTGGASGTAKVKGNDWDLIKQTLYPVFSDRIYFNVPLKNPRERQRVNAVNSRLKSATGNVRMLIDGSCKYLIKDLEGVRVLEGSAGEIDKKRDPKLTHLSDALGYYVHKEFPIASFYSREDIQAMMKSLKNKDPKSVLGKNRKAA